jgi:Na+-driven multidrug efflux pump
MLKPPRVVVRNSGRLLLSVADLATILAPVAADWNGSHVFNEEWPSHARFHGIVGLGTPVALSSFALWHLWRSSNESSLARAVAAAVPITYWGSFFPALLVRGTGLDDPPHPVGRIAGLPANVFWAGVTTASAFAGWLVDARMRSTTRRSARTR